MDEAAAAEIPAAAAAAAAAPAATTAAASVEMPPLPPPTASETTPEGTTFASPTYVAPIDGTTGSATTTAMPSMTADGIDFNTTSPTDETTIEGTHFHMPSVPGFDPSEATPATHNVPPVDATDHEATLSPTGIPAAFEMAPGGQCVIEGMCVKTPGYDSYPAAYNTHEHCDIKVVMPGSIQTDCDNFHTERQYDQLHIDGVVYEGSRNDPHYSRRRNNMTRRRRRNPTANYSNHFKCPDGIHVNSASQIVWNSDYSVTRAGWKLCLHPTPLGGPEMPPMPSSHP